MKFFTYKDVYISQYKISLNQLITVLIKTLMFHSQQIGILTLTNYKEILINNQTRFSISHTRVHNAQLYRIIYNWPDTCLSAKS
jgi:hypothetical protein